MTQKPTQKLWRENGITKKSCQKWPEQKRLLNSVIWQHKAHEWNALVLRFLLVSDLFLYVSSVSQKVRKSKTAQIEKMVNIFFFFYEGVAFTKRNKNRYYFLIDLSLFGFCGTDYICRKHTIDRVIVCPYVRFWYSIEYQKWYSIEYFFKVD